MTVQHTNKEIAIFQAFSKICPMSIKHDSITKKEPPEPDIQCEVIENGILAFELVEIIDKNLANILYKQIETKKKFSQFYSQLPLEKKLHFDRIYSNALIFLNFKNESTKRQREKLFPDIIDHLLKLDEKFEGDTFIIKYENELIGINISRGGYTSPLFNTPSEASLLGDPTVGVIRSKFKDKTYKSDYPIHLLVYIDINLMPPQDIWLPSVEEFVKTSLNISQFKRVWIFDYQKNEIIFIYP